MADRGRIELRGDFRWEDDIPHPRVTWIIDDVLAKPALRRWYGKQVYLAMTANPSLSEKEALAAPYQISEKAKDRGATVHSIVEAWRQNQVFLDNVSEPFRGYAKGFYKWVEDHEVDIVEHEREFTCKEYRYSGKVDLLVHLNGAELPIVADVKTGKYIYDEAWLQLSAYRQGLAEDGIETAGIGVILLHDNGSYTFQHQAEDHFTQFLAFKPIWAWKNRTMLAELAAYCLKSGKKQAHEVITGWLRGDDLAKLAKYSRSNGKSSQPRNGQRSNSRKEADNGTLKF
jgi:hypothetical protein